MSAILLLQGLFLSYLLFLADATSSTHLRPQYLDEPPKTRRGKAAVNQVTPRIWRQGLAKGRMTPWKAAVTSAPAAGMETLAAPVEGTENQAPAVTPRTLNRERKAKLAREFLEAHNEARESMGSPPLKWDRTLARVAAQWTANLRSDCKVVHSDGSYGENLFWHQRNHWTPARVVEAWVAEKKNYDPNTNTCVQDQMCGHYTQIVWRNTGMLGCAHMKCDNNAGYVVVCEYYPPGNYEGETPFDDVKENKDQNGRD